MVFKQKILMSILTAILIISIISISNVQAQLLDKEKPGIDLWGYDNVDDNVESPLPTPDEETGPGYWQKANLVGWTECNDVPFWLRVTAPAAGTFVVWIVVDYQDKESDFGVDFLRDFSLETSTGVTSATIHDAASNTNTLPYQGGYLGDSTYAVPWGGVNMRYIFTVTFSGAGQADLLFFAHLAKGDTEVGDDINGISAPVAIPDGDGAEAWSHDSIHVSSEPQFQAGSQDTTITPPGVSGNILVDKTMEGRKVEGAVWDITKSVSPTGPITLTPGEEKSLTITIIVTRTELLDECQVRGTITLTNTFTTSQTIDWIDQLLDGDPDFPAGISYEQWSGNDLIIPPGTTEIPITGGSWQSLTGCPGHSIYNVVWVGWGEGVTSTNPTPSANWQDSNYEHVTKASYQFDFPTVGGDPDSIRVWDDEWTVGPLSIIESSIVVDPDYTADEHWDFTEESTGTFTITIDKRIRCEGPGSAQLNDQAFGQLAPDSKGPESDIETEVVTVSVFQSPILEEAPVGGYATPINKISILAPYLAIALLFSAVLTMTVIRKKYNR